MADPQHGAECIRVDVFQAVETVQVGGQAAAATVGVTHPPVGAAGFLHQRNRFVVYHGGAGAHDFVMAGFEGPAQFATEQIDGEGFAGVGCRGKHLLGAKCAAEQAGQRVGAAQVPGEHRDGVAPGFVEHHDAGVGFLVLQVGGDEADDRTERDDTDDAVECGEQCRDLISGLAGEAGKGAWCGRFGFGVKLLRGEQGGAGQRCHNLAGERNAVTGDGDDGDFVVGEGKVLGHGGFFLLYGFC